jgi:hypothetical protein
MAAFKRRTRFIIFRLTEDEYKQLREACLKRGARTVSDFARTELLRSVGGDGEDLTDRLAGIESGMRRLERLLAGIAGRKAKK